MPYRRRMKVCLLVSFLVMILGTAVVSAREEVTESLSMDDEAMTMPPGYTDISDRIPTDIAELLPDGLFSENVEDALEATEAMTDWQYLCHALMRAVGLRLDDAVKLLCTLIGLLLMAAILGRLRENIGGKTGELFGICLRLVMFAIIVTQTAETVEAVQLFFSELTSLTGGMVPVMGALYAMGGNIGQAALNEELMMVFLSVLSYVSTTVTPPVCALCMVFSLMDAFGSRLTFAALAEQVKRWYTSLLGLCMFILTVSLSAQSVLVGRADSWGMRGVKYAVGNLLPIVGGSVAGTLGVVAEGVRMLRGVCGVSGVILVALLLLPTLVQLLLFRAMLRMAATIASLLGCDGEAHLITDMASLHGYLAAAVSICAIIFIVALSLLIHSGAALSG